MKKCPFCAEEILDLAVKCRYCGEFIEKKDPEKWYYKTYIIVMAFLCVGPLALPLVWIHPRYSRYTKFVVSIVTVFLSILMAILMSASMKALINYYDQFSDILGS